MAKIDAAGISHFVLRSIIMFGITYLVWNKLLEILLPFGRIYNTVKRRCGGLGKIKWEAWIFIVVYISLVYFALFRYLEILLLLELSFRSGVWRFAWLTIPKIYFSFLFSSPISMTLYRDIFFYFRKSIFREKSFDMT